MNIKDSSCNKHCRISLHNVGGKLVQTLDSGPLGWDGDADGDGEIYTGMGMGMGNFLCGRGGDGDNFMGTGWGKFYGDGAGMGTILFTVSLSSRVAGCIISVRHYVGTRALIYLQ